MPNPRVLGGRPRLGLLGAFLAFLVLAGQAAVPWSAPRAIAQESLAGQLLVATPEMLDPRFEKSVIFVVIHDVNGAFDLVVNRPIAEVPLATLLERFGIEDGGAEGAMRVHCGGPVQRYLGFFLHSADYADEHTIRVNDGFAMTVKTELFRAIAKGRSPSRLLFALGYAGWTSGQIEGEIEEGAWITVPAENDLVFGEDHESKWRRAFDLRHLDL